MISLLIEIIRKVEYEDMKKKRKNRNSLFFKLSLTLTFSLVITILMVSAILYKNFEDIILNNIYSNSSEGLIQINTNVNFMIDSSKNLLVQAYSDRDIYKLLIYPTTDIDEKNLGLERLNLYVATSPIIHSIYAYNSENSTIFTSVNNQAVENFDGFFDQDILKKLFSKNFKNFYPIARNVPKPGFGSTSYKFYKDYSFIYNESGVNSISSGIIINVSENWLKNIIKNVDSSNNSQTFISDKNGVIMTSNAEYEMLSDMSENQTFKNIINNYSKNGWIIGNVFGQKSLITFYKSDTVDWYYIRVTPYKTIIEKISKLRETTIFVSVLILLVGILLSIFISRFMYIPIKDMVAKVKVLEQDKNKSSYYFKQKHLVSLLLDSQYADADDYVNEKLNNYDVYFVLEKGLIVLYLGIDNYNNFKKQYKPDDISIFKYGMMNITSEIFSRLGICEVVDMGGEHFTVILNFVKKPSANIQETLNEAILQLFEAINRYLNITVSIAYSDVFFDLSDINNNYFSALNIYKYKMYFGYSSILNNTAISLFKKSNKVQTEEKEKLLIESLMVGKSIECKKLFSEIIEVIKNQVIEQFRISILNIAITISSAVLIIEENTGNNTNYDFCKFISEINKVETIPELKNYFEEMFDFVSDYLTQQKNLKHDNLINIATCYIENNYNDINLSLEGISSHFHLSSSYFGRIFKTQIKKSVADYIIYVRLKKAKVLLENGNLTICEIIEKVGFVSNSYFYTIFKKTYGCTPSEYRQTSSIKNITDENNKI